MCYYYGDCMCCTLCTLDIVYRLITPHGSNILNPIIPNKPRLCTRFDSTVMKYAFIFPPPKVGVKGKEIHR